MGLTRDGGNPVRVGRERSREALYEGDPTSYMEVLDLPRATSRGLPGDE